MPDDSSDPENARPLDDVVEATILGALMFGIAGLCRSVGITDPALMDCIARKLIQGRPPATPGEAAELFERAAGFGARYERRQSV